MIKSLLFIALALATAESLCAEVLPSSEIPDRREFPLSTKIEACDDFHKYVCDEAESRFKLRDDRSYHVFAFSDSSERLLEAKKKFFSGIEKEKKLSPRIAQVKNFYLACMNEKGGAQSEKSEIEKIKKALERIKTPKEFILFQIQAKKSGQDSFIFQGIDTDKENPDAYNILLLADLMNLPERSYYENKELMAEYRSIAIDLFKIIEPKSKAIESRVDKMIELEKAFAQAFPLPAEQRQRWSENRQEPQANILKKYPQLQLQELFKSLPKKAFVFNPVPESLDFLQTQLDDQHLEAFKDLYAFGSLREILDDSQPEFFKKNFSFNHKFLGAPEKRSERDERCTRLAMSSFPKEIDMELMKRLFPHFPEEKVRTVGQRIRQSIIDGLQQNTWLSAAAKETAVKKIEKARLFLVKPQNDKEWDFTPVQSFSKDHRIANTQKLAKARYEKRIKDSHGPVNKEAWAMGPLTVNAYYDASANKFVMPMGILQYPFFDPQGDLIENLGAVGAVMGHELGHGIDDQGSKYDVNGKLQQWMTMNDLKEFTTRGERMVKQFDKAGVNGALTLGENVADLVGLSFAYKAAFPDGQASVQDQQKFFVAYGRLWCNVVRPKFAEQLLKTDPHSPGSARINEQVKHQKEFAKAFSCKKGSKMTLPEKEIIKIW